MNTIHFSPAQFAGAREEELLHQVEEHKYLANQNIPYEISMEEAFDSWNLLVFSPLSEAIESEGLNRVFPEVGKGELFLWVSRHWHYMKQNLGEDVTVRQAVLDFGTRFSPDAISRFGFFLKRVAA